MSAMKATVAGVKLFQLNFATAVITGDKEDRTVGWVLWHDDPEVWKSKLQYYDQVEGFYPDDYK